MREIKHKIWYVPTKEFLNIDGVYIDCDGFVHIELEKNLSTLREDFIIIQYTGQKDKNEKEIYEGYIIKSGEPDNYLGEVKYSEEYAAFLIFWKSIMHTEACSSLMTYNKDHVIIGNIYENPELRILKEE